MSLKERFLQGFKRELERVVMEARNQSAIRREIKVLSENKKKAEKQLRELILAYTDMIVNSHKYRIFSEMTEEEKQEYLSYFRKKIQGTADTVRKLEKAIEKNRKRLLKV